MTIELKTKLLKVCTLLERNKVRYLLVGGAAVALHGYFRLSTNPNGEMLEKPDIDVWYDPTYENYFRLLNVISELGKDTSEFRKEQTPRPRSSFFRLDFEEFSIDLLPEINSKIRFIDAFSNRIVLEYEGVTILLIALNDLIKDKESSGRTKDKEDIENLKRINKLP